MRMICSECGHEIPEDSDFCYHCGAKADKCLRLDDDKGVLYSNFCGKCGADLPRDSMFCPNCGEPIAKSSAIVRTPRKLAPNAILALFLAIVPGFFDIFGLGQLVLKRWSKAFIYLTLTVFLWYLEPSFAAEQKTAVFFMFVQLGVFFFQMTDIFNNMYVKEE